MDVQNSFFSFFGIYVFVNNKITVITRKVFFLRKYRHFNSLSNATHPIHIRRAVLEKLQFEKKSEKNFNLKYLWNLWINPLAQRIVSIGVQNIPLQKNSKQLSQFYSSYATTKKITFFYKFFFPKYWIKKQKLSKL